MTARSIYYFTTTVYEVSPQTTSSLLVPLSLPFLISLLLPVSLFVSAKPDDSIQLSPSFLSASLLLTAPQFVRSIFPTRQCVHGRNAVFGEDADILGQIVGLRASKEKEERGEVYAAFRSRESRFSVDECDG